MVPTVVIAAVTIKKMTLDARVKVCKNSDTEQLMCHV